MRTVRVIGGGLAVALVTVAACAASAFAEAPEFGRCLATSGGKYTNSVCTKAAKPGKVGIYEWDPGAIKNKFTGVGGAATLETVGHVKVTCKAETSSGEYTSPKTVGNINVVFTGCQGFGDACKTSGANSGEIVVNPLAGTLVWEDSTKKKVAIDLIPQSGEVFVEFTCGSAVTAEVKGSVLTNVPANKVVTKIEEKFSAKNGKQKPEYYYTGAGEEIKDVLEAKIGAFGAELEQAGQTVTNTQTDEEAGEVNTAV